MKLLIAEDEAIIRMDLKETLQDLGYEVIAEARSGREAVQKAFAFAPDCALMDFIWMAMTDSRQLRKSRRHSYAPL